MPFLIPIAAVLIILAVIIAIARKEAQLLSRHGTDEDEMSAEKDSAGAEETSTKAAEEDLTGEEDWTVVEMLEGEGAGDDAMATLGTSRERRRHRLRLQWRPLSAK